MRFELSVALKYLIPRWRQLSVSIISLISVLVISLVVWLVIVFLSVTDGIEKKWIEELVAINGPLRMNPTEAYYQSYFYQIDSISYDSNYTTKTIGEKLRAPLVDPYDPTVDAELPLDFPQPTHNPDGSVKDLAKEAWNAVLTLNRFPNLRPQEYEVTFGNLRLNLVRDEGRDTKQTSLSQVSYISSYDGANARFYRMLLPPSTEDLNNLFKHLSLPNEEDQRKMDGRLAPFFENVTINAVQTPKEGYRIPRSLYPAEGRLKGCGIMHNSKITKVVIPHNRSEVKGLAAQLEAFGHEVFIGEISFEEGNPSFHADNKTFHRLQLYLDGEVTLPSRYIPDSLPNPQVEINAPIQDLLFKGVTQLEQLEIAEAKPTAQMSTEWPPFWVYQKSEKESIVPTGNSLGDGILIPKNFRDSGVRLGDQGYLSYYSPTASSMQEQRIPVYVAGFYDPGFMPVGNKITLVDPSITATLRGNMAVADSMLGNGVNLWLPRIEDAKTAKVELQKALDERGLGKYWRVESYADYEFAKPIIEQLQSDKTLFTLIAVIILIVACSNIISMLILLVNDKKHEIGILQSMGASSGRIAAIFGLCGFLTGLVSSIIGTLAALYTLHNLQALVNFLSFLQGHEAFQAAFYGSVLPNELSTGALLFVLGATTIISLLAGLAPAIKAARIRPSEILRAE